MSVSEKFGDLGIIENESGIPHQSEHPVEIGSWEALVRHGEVVVERVHTWNTKLQQDTLAELNQVIASSRLPQNEVFEARHHFGVDDKLKKGFHQMDLLANTTAQEITAAATAHQQVSSGIFTKTTKEWLKPFFCFNCLAVRINSVVYKN